MPHLLALLFFDDRLSGLSVIRKSVYFDISPTSHPCILSSFSNSDLLILSFPVIAKGYDLLLTDTSHKVRRGLSQCFMLGNYTTATIQYICDNIALVGQVATIPEERGRFHARKLLYWIGEKLNKDGIIVRLFARSNRVSYYEEIGFKELNVDIVFERKDYFARLAHLRAIKKEIAVTTRTWGTRKTRAMAL